MDVDVDVQHSLVHLEQLEDGQHDVVDVTKTGGFVFLCVVQTARPVDHGVRLLVVQTHGAAHGAAGVNLAEVEQTVEDGAVLRAVEPLQLAHVLVLVIGGDQPQKLHVLVAVELRHVLRGRQSGRKSCAARSGAGRWERNENRQYVCRSRRSRELGANPALTRLPGWRRAEKTKLLHHLQTVGKCRGSIRPTRGNRFGKNQGYRPSVVPPSPCRCHSGAGGCGSCARGGASWGAPGRSRSCPHQGRRSTRSSACPPSFKNVRGAKPNTKKLC